MITESCWRLEFSENQQCFHQDCQPYLQKEDTNGYFTLLTDTTPKQCQAFIKFVRLHSGDFISKNEILSWRDDFLDKEFFISCNDCPSTFNVKMHGVRCPNCQTLNL